MVVVLGGEHTEVLRASGWSNYKVKQFLYDNAIRSIADLKRAGLVSERKEGRWVFHRLVDEDAPFLSSVWQTVSRDPRVQADAKLLRQIRKVDIAELCRVDLDLGRLGIRRSDADGSAEARKGTG